MIPRQDNQPFSCIIQQCRAGISDGQPVSCTLGRWAGMLVLSISQRCSGGWYPGKCPSGWGSEDAGLPELNLPELVQEK